MTMIDIFIPSYHRPSNVKTAKYFIKNGYNPNKIHVVLDDAADDIEEYKTEMDKLKCKIHIFNMQSSIDNYDYVHKAYEHRRSTGQCINMIYDIAKSLNLNFFFSLKMIITEIFKNPLFHFIYIKIRGSANWR